MGWWRDEKGETVEVKKRWTHGFKGSAFRIHDSTAVVISSRDVYGIQRLRIALCIAVQSW